MVRLRAVRSRGGAPGARGRDHPGKASKVGIERGPQGRARRRDGRMRQAIGALSGSALMRKMARVAAVAFGLLALGAGAAMAQGAPGGMVGAPEAWGIGLQAGRRPDQGRDPPLQRPGLLDHRRHHDLRLRAAGRGGGEVPRRARTRTPSTTSHNTTLEIAWTVVPVLILVVIAIPSFRLIYYQDRAVDAGADDQRAGPAVVLALRLSRPGQLHLRQLPGPRRSDLAQGQLRNLSVDNPLVIPVGANIRILTTGQDVIHSFFVPSLGVQRYTIPGRTLETWIRADRARRLSTASATRSAA